MSFFIFYDKHIYYTYYFFNVLLGIATQSFSGSIDSWATTARNVDLFIWYVVVCCETSPSLASVMESPAEMLVV